MEQKIKNPFKRDYDKDGKDNPSAWAKQYNLDSWGIFMATEGEDAIGGISIAVNDSVFPSMRMQRRDLAILWDIRVHPKHKRKGIGKALFNFAMSWAKENGYNQLGIETDGSNIPACKFYAKMGCELGAIFKYGYSGIPEVASYPMLLWYLDLDDY